MTSWPQWPAPKAWIFDSEISEIKPPWKSANFACYVHIRMVITFLSKIQNHSKKLSNYGRFSKIGRKNHYLEISKSKIGRKTTTLNFWNQKLEGKTTTLKNWIKRMEGNSTTPKNCVLTHFLHERSIIFLLVFSLIWF